MSSLSSIMTRAHDRIDARVSDRHSARARWPRCRSRVRARPDRAAAVALDGRRARPRCTSSATSSASSPKRRPAARSRSASFPSGTLGQEREVVQQLQEGLVDFMVSGTAIWGSVAPKLQVFDFPFLWRDWAHVHGVVDGTLGREAADYLERTVRMRPLAWGDSFGFRQVITRSRDVTEPGQLAGLKIRTIQSPIYVKAVELMGASPTPMAFGEVYTSLQTGVIDGYEHDASTTLQQRFYEVAHYMARTAPHRRRARPVRVDREPGPPARRPARDARAGGARGRAAPARDGTAGGCRPRPAQLAAHGMTIREIDGARLPAARRAALGTRSARARRRPLARGDPRVTTAHRRRHRRIVQLPRRRRSRPAPVVDCVPRRRPGGRRRPAGRRPPRPAPADSRGPRKSRACCSSG